MRASGTITLHTCTQGGWLLADILAGVLKIDPSKVRILTPDVGGGFGMKAFFYPEYAMAAWASRLIGRPVKWTGERSETFLSDVQGRDHVTEAELALDADHRILGMRVETTANMGAYSSLFGPFIPTGAAIKVLPGVYDVKNLVYRVKGVLTNTTPVDAYRGAGRPKSIYLMERLMAAAAREVGRGSGRVPPQELHPVRGHAVQDRGRRDLRFGRVRPGHGHRARGGRLDAASPGARRRASARGLRRGIGMSYYIESTMGDPQEAAKISFEEDGTVSVAVGTQSNGQGHETAYMQLLNDRLGIPFERIRIVQGDTAKLKWGGGTGGSRSLTAEGMAIRDASDVVIERGKMFASQEFEAAVADIDFERADGTFRVKGTDRAIGILELAGKVRGKALGHGRRDAGPGCRGDGQDRRLDLPQRLPRRRGRDRPRDRGHPDRQLHRGRRLRRRDQPAAGDRPGPRRRGPGHRPGAVRARGLRRQRPAAVRARSWTTACRAPTACRRCRSRRSRCRARTTRSASRAAARPARSPRPRR